MPTVEPEIIPVLVDQENLSRKPRRDGPLPFHQDRLTRADHSHQAVSILRQFPVQLAAPFTPAIIRRPINARILRKTLREPRITGDQIDSHVLSPCLPKPRAYPFEQTSRSAF